MKKWITVLLAAVLALTAFGCTEPTEGPPDGQVVASRVTTAGGVPVVEVDGKPFPYLAGEMRFEAYMNCDGATPEDYEKYVAAAAGLGLTVMTVSIDWRDLEPEKDAYDFDVIRSILGYALQYGIKVEFLWYSTLMCGRSHSYHIPEYIVADPATYPRYTIEQNGSTRDYFGDSTYYGRQFMLELDNPALLERERRMLEKLMAFVYDWEEARQFPKVLIGMQIYNEPDAFPEKHLETYAMQLNGAPQTKEATWEKVRTAMNAAAKVVKNAKYTVYTRTNLLRPAATSLGNTAGFSPLSAAKAVYDLPNIDCVGFDPYYQSVGYLAKSIEAYRDALPENVTHLAENGGEYTNTDTLMLLSLSLNCGYTVYELASPLFFAAAHDQGILDKTTLGDKYADVGKTDNYTARARTMIRGLRAAGSHLMTHRDNFAAFNVVSDYPSDYISQRIDTTHVSLKFESENTALGYAIETADGYLLAFATRDAALTLGNGTFGAVEIGRYDGDVFTKTGDGALDGTTLALTGGTFYRVKLESSLKTLQSTTANYKAL